jgi:endoglucanase Acf2
MDRVTTELLYTDCVTIWITGAATILMDSKWAGTSNLGGTIDTSWIDCTYKAPTCDDMYYRQRRHLDYGGKI